MEIIFYLFFKNKTETGMELKRVLNIKKIRDRSCY